MQIGTKFSVAIHILLCVEVFKKNYKVTSDFIAGSVNTNPVVIRKLMAMLKDARIIDVAAGTGGITLVRNAAQITLIDIFRAVEPVKNRQLFKIHEDSVPDCPVGSKIESLLQPCFTDAQQAMEDRLATLTLQNLLDNLEKAKAKK